METSSSCSNVILLKECSTIRLRQVKVVDDLMTWFDLVRSLCKTDKAAFSIPKSLWVLQETHVKCVARVIYTYLFFFLYMYSPLPLENKKLWSRFPQLIRPQTTVQWYILWDYSSVRIGFSMISKRHILPIVYTTLAYTKFQSLLFH